MPWLWFILALIMTSIVQTTVLPLFAPEWLDLLLVLGLVCGLAAPVQEARLAGWLTGFAADLDTSGPVGLHALALGLAVLGLTYLRELVNLRAWWVRWLIGFIVALPAELLVGLHQRFLQGVGFSGSQIVIGALVTAAVASFLASVVTALPVAFRRRRRRSLEARW